MNTECARGDHDPEPADDLLPVPACRRCGRILTIGPPSGHLESMTAELSPDDEAYLAALDEDLFPEAAKPGDTERQAITHDHGDPMEPRSTLADSPDETRRPSLGSRMLDRADTALLYLVLILDGMAIAAAFAGWDQVIMAAFRYVSLSGAAFGAVVAICWPIMRMLERADRRQTADGTTRDESPEDAS